MTEHWRDIPDTGGLYQISTEGRVRRYWPKSRKYTYLTLYTHKSKRKNANKKQVRCRIQLTDGRRVERPVMKLVAEVFIGIPEGMVAVHRNGDRSDNSITNIQFMDARKLGVTFGVNACRRPVVKITPNGEVLDAYKSAREAGRQNYMSYQMVMDRCNGKRKREFADGYSFRWDDEKGDKRYE